MLHALCCLLAQAVKLPPVMLLLARRAGGLLVAAAGVTACVHAVGFIAALKICSRVMMTLDAE